MPLSLRIDTAQAQQSADAFKRILNDVRTAAATIDALNFNRLGSTLDAIVTRVSRLADQFQRLRENISLVAGELTVLRTSLNTTTDPQALRALTAQFNELRSAARGLRQDVTGIGREIGQATRIRVTQNTQTQNINQTPQQNTTLPFFQQATSQTVQTMNSFSQSLVTAKQRKDELDANLKKTASSTLPGFYQSLLVSGLGLALFRRGLSELSEAGRELFEVGRRVEAIEAVFRNATSSVDQASRLFLIAKERAKDLGLDVLATSEELGKLSLAAKGTSLEGEKIERLFKGITAAEAVLIQTTGQAGGLIKVFTDILGKGRLQSEELIKQLGNRLPGSIRVVGEALGKTPQELATAVQRGTVQVEEVLVKLGDELVRRFGGEASLNVRRLGGAFNNLRTSILELQLLVVQGGFSTALIAAFKTLQTFLEDSRTRAAVLTLAKIIVDSLGAAFMYLIQVLGVLRDNLTLVILILASLVGTAAIVGVLALGRAFLLLARAAGLFGTASAAASKTNLVILIASLAASFIAGSVLADKFAGSITGVEEALKKQEEEAQRLRDLPPIINNNAPDETRSFVDSLERINKEIRVFSQELENQVRLFIATQNGLSTLGVGYAAYEKTLSRIRALEKNNTFNNVNQQNENQAKSAVVSRLLSLAFAEQTLDSLNKNNQELERLVQERESLAATFQRASESFGKTGTSSLGTQIQQEYETKILPSLQQAREQIQFFTGIGARDVAENIAGAFNEWNKSLRANIISIKNLQAELRAVNQIADSLRELSVNRVISRITRTPASSATLVPARDPLEAGREAIQQLGRPQTIETTLRSLGPEFERFGKEQAARLGVSIQEFFKQQDPSKAIENILREQVKLLEQIAKNTGGEGGIPHPSERIGATGQASGQYAALITQSALRYGIDPELASRVINLGEASGATAISPKGAVGVAQVLPTTAQPYLPGRSLVQITESLKDPATSIEVGIRYLADQLKNFDGNVTKAVAAYNAGPGAVQRAGGVPNISETQAYVSRTLSGYRGTGYAAVQAGISNVGNETVRPYLTDQGSFDQQVKDFQRNQRFGFYDRLRRVFDTSRESQGLPPSPGVGETARNVVDAINRFLGSTPGRYTEYSSGTGRYLPRQSASNAGTFDQQVRDFETYSAGNAGDTINELRQRQEARNRIDQFREQGRVAEIGRGSSGETPVKYLADTLAELLNSIKPVEQLQLSIGNLNDSAIEGLNRQSQAFLSARAQQDLSIESLRAAERVYNSFALTEEEVAANTDKVKTATILAAQAYAVNYANGIERAVIAGNQLSTQLTDEIASLNLQRRALQENVNTRDAWLAAEQRRLQLIASGAAADEEGFKRLLALNEELRKAQQNLNDLNSNPLRKLGDSLDQLEKTGEKQFVVDGINSITDALAGLAATADYSLGNLQNIFLSVFQSLVREAVKLVIQLYIIKPLLASLNVGSGISGLLGGGTGVAGALAGGGNAAGLISSSILSIGGGAALSASGGIVGYDQTNTRHLPVSLFAGAPRFQAGGIVGTDSIPALLTPGEGVFTSEQMRRLAPVNQQGGDSYNFSVSINATDGESVRRTVPQIAGEVYSRLQRTAARDGLVRKQN